MEPNITPPEKHTTPKTVSGGEVMINMEGMIKNYYDSTENLKTEIKKLNEMFQDFFNQDPTYREHKEANEQTKKVLQATKAEISKKVQVAEMALKLKDLKGELKENKAAMSDYLQEYGRMSGVTEIEMSDGKLLEIVVDYKLVPKQGRLF